ncbi:MAG: polysaccharide deacetylase family protein [Pleurocapsa sp.]
MVLGFLVACLVIIVGILLFPSPRLILFLSPYICPEAVYFADTKQPIIALTIDDSPSNITPEILKVLQKYQVKATFFPIANQIKINKNLFSQIIEEEHELGNHLTEDEPSIKLGDQFATEFLKADQILSEFTTPVWMRPGGGFCNQEMVKIVKNYNYKIALGTVWAYDTHVLFPEFSSWFILKNIHPGAIIVLHDSSDRDPQNKRAKNTVKTLNIIIPKLQQRGYKFVTLTQLIHRTNMTE